MNYPSIIAVNGARQRSRVALTSILFAGCHNVELPDIADSTRLAERIAELSQDCTSEDCLQFVTLQRTYSYNTSFFDVPEGGFFIQYYCSLSNPGRMPVLGHTEALTQIAEECNAVDGRSHLVFPHWWETTCFFSLNNSDYGTVQFPDFVEDPADFLYVSCMPETLIGG